MRHGGIEALDKVSWYYFYYLITMIWVLANYTGNLDRYW